VAHSDQRTRGSNESAEYDLFLSYSTDPDYALARNLEVFLRTFHRREILNRRQLPELRVFLDSSSLLRRSSRDQPQQIGEMLNERLAVSKRILVLCSRQAMRSEHVQYEVDWYLSRNRACDMWLAVTEGEDPAAAPHQYFSAAIRAAGLTRQIWFDFRGYRKGARGWHKVRDFERERVRLASDLVGIRVEDLYPEWLEQEQRAARRRARRNAIFAAVTAVLAAVALWFGIEQRLQRIRAEALVKLGEIRRTAAQSIVDIDQQPEQALEASARAWADWKVLDKARPESLSIESAVARSEALHALFTALGRHPFLETHLRRSGPSVEALASSADGSWIAAGDSRGQVNIWNMREKKPTPFISEAANVGAVVSTAVYSPPLRVAIAGTSAMEVWTFENEKLHRSRADVEGTQRMAWSPDGRLIALSMADGSVLTVPVGEITQSNRLGQFPSAGSALLFLDNDLLLSGSQGPNGFWIFNLGRHGPPTRRFGQNSWAVHTLARQTETNVVSGHENGDLVVWDWTKGLNLVHAATKATVYAIGASGRKIFSAHNDSSIRFWTWTGKELQLRRTIWAHRGGVFGLVILENPLRMVSSGSDGAIRIWRTESNDPLEKVLARNSPRAQEVAFADSGEIIGLGRGTATRWSGDGSSTVISLPPGTREAKLSALDSEGKHIAFTPPFGSTDRKVYFVDVTKPTQTPVAFSGATEPPWSLAISARSRFLALATRGPGLKAELIVWRTDVPSARSPAWLKSESIENMTFDRGERLLATVDPHGLLKIWDVATGKLLARVSVARGLDIPSQLAFGKNDELLALGYLSGTLVVVKSKDPGQALFVREWHRSYVSALAFSPTGQWLASAGEEGLLGLWETEEFQRVAEWRDPDQSFIRSLCFRPDGKELAIAGQGGSRVSSLDVDPDSWAQRAMEVAGPSPDNIGEGK
jgi:WD40 repeat protein